jgi:hypothetical protein
VNHGSYEKLVNRARMMLHLGMSQSQTIELLLQDTDKNTAYLATKGAVVLNKLRNIRES